MLVWVSGWQMECCGDPFAVGSKVTWTLDEESDRHWLTAVLGAELASTVHSSQEHHGGLPDEAPWTTGTVTRIRAVSCRYGADPSDPSGKVLTPLPGTARVDELPEADRRYPEPDGLHFNGYLVDLREDG